MSLEGLVTNRTSAVQYTQADLNRVEEAVAELQAALLAAGYGDGSLETKTDWASGDIQREPNMARYLENVAALIDMFSVFPSTPELPATMDDLTFTGANAIERILADIEALIYTMQHTVDLGWSLGIAHVGLYGGIS